MKKGMPKYSSDSESSGSSSDDELYVDVIKKSRGNIMIHVCQDHHRLAASNYRFQQNSHMCVQFLTCITVHVRF